MTDVEMSDLGSAPQTIENDASSAFGKRSLTLNSRSTTLRSHTSDRSWRPKSLLRRFTSQPISSSWEDRIEQADLIGRREFLTFLNCNFETPLLQDSAYWYSVFMEHKINNFWTLFRRGLTNINKTDALPSIDDKTTAFRVIIAVAENLSSCRGLSLARAVNKLINDELLEDGESLEDRERLYVLIFALIGWLSFIYEPRALSESNVRSREHELEVTRLSYHSSGDRTATQSRRLARDSTDFEDVDQPLYIMLGVFGTLIPGRTSSKRSISDTPPEFITASHLCYHTLRKVCRIEIEWVDTMSMHLELDSSGRLKLFRLPSFCLITYREKNKKGFLDQLFHDNSNSNSHVLQPTGFGQIPATASDFLSEILVTYRLLFGQDAQSWKLFAKEMQQAKSRGPKSLWELDDADPLLPILCAQSCDTTQASEVYNHIRADDVMSTYASNSFPFFGSKILLIQDYVVKQNPWDLTSLLHDKRRHPEKYWALVTGLIIGGSTIILMVLSLIFQIWQVILAQQQLSQGSRRL